MSDAIFKSGMMCPVKVIGNPGMLMSHTCVDLIFLPSGRLTVSGFNANRLFSTSTPSITNMDVAPVSATAIFVAMVMAFKYCGFGLPYNILANAPNNFGSILFVWLLWVATFDVMTVLPSSSASVTTLINSVGSGK